MRKKIAGFTLIAATTLLAFHPTPMINGENTLATIHEEKVLISESPVGGKIKQEPLSIPTNQVPITLVETVDGDTIKVKVMGKMETIRYLLIDTPESKKPGMCVQPYAKEAYVRNSQLVRGGSLSMEFEQGATRDSYGRLLTYVFADGNSVQETLLKEGFARVAYIMNPPYKYLTAYRADESFAKRMELNIWKQANYVSYRGFIGCVPLK